MRESTRRISGGSHVVSGCRVRVFETSMVAGLSTSSCEPAAARSMSAAGRHIGGTSGRFRTRNIRLMPSAGLARTRAAGEKRISPVPVDKCGDKRRRCWPPRMLSSASTDCPESGQGPEPAELVPRFRVTPPVPAPSDADRNVPGQWRRPCGQFAKRRRRTQTLARPAASLRKSCIDWAGGCNGFAIIAAAPLCPIVRPCAISIR